MKIKVTIERECCQNEDLKSYNGKQCVLEKFNNIKFCIHCGQIWVDIERNDEVKRHQAYPTFDK